MHTKTIAMTQAWYALVDTIRLLPSGRTLDDDRKAQLHEKQTLDSALEQLSVLIDMKKTGVTPRVSPAPGTEGTMTPPSGTKRKRRPSIGVSLSPGPGGDLLSASSPHPGRGSTPLREAAKRQRPPGDTSDQLPLAPGRKVAARQRQKLDAEGEEWILAKVVKMVGGDKQRYEVQDADDGTRWTTTLKNNIILLPDPEAPVHLSSNPANLEDFPRGSQVLGLYPDTTSFYRATVVSAPIPGTGMGRGVRGGNGRADPGAKPGVYRLAFVDDGDNISDVVKDLVVMVGQSQRQS